MQAIKSLEQSHLKSAVPQVQSGDTVRVHQLIREGNKQRVQVFEGVVIRTRRTNSLTAAVTVRRIASGVGVEKTFLVHSPNITKIEVMRRAKVRRNYLSYLRGLRGKAARLKEVAFDKKAANDVSVKEQPAAQASEEPADADTTEIDAQETGQVEAEVSTEEVAKQENKEAAADETPAGSPSDDEEAAKAEQTEAGVDKAEQQDTSKQA